MSLDSIEVEAVDWVKGIPFPQGARFRQIIVTGPPSSGKTTLIRKLGGWPEEGYIDLARNNWWHNRILTFRPREVHFGFPFKGFRESHAVFDREWLESPAAVDLKRVQIPPGKRWTLGIDWRRKFIFDFQLLPPELIYDIRKARAVAGTHPVDECLTKDEVVQQLAVYESLALHFHRCGMQVFVRNSFEGLPRTIVESEAG